MPVEKGLITHPSSADHTIQDLATYKFGFGLVITITVAQPSIAALAPGVELPGCGDTGTVGPTGCDHHHLLAPQTLYHAGTVTRAR